MSHAASASASAAKNANMHHKRLRAWVSEFAFAFSLLLVLAVGLLECVRLKTLRHAADNAAYEAARRAATPGAKVDEAVASASEVLARAGVTEASIVVTPGTLTADTARVTARVEVPVSDNSWFPAVLTSRNAIARETTLIAERPPAIRARGLHTAAHPDASEAGDLPTAADESGTPKIRRPREPSTPRLAI